MLTNAYLIRTQFLCSEQFYAHSTTIYFSRVLHVLLSGFNILLYCIYSLQLNYILENDCSDNTIYDVFHLEYMENHMSRKQNTSKGGREGRMEGGREQIGVGSNI